MNKIRNKKILLYVLLASLISAKMTKLAEEKNKIKFENSCSMDKAVMNSEIRIDTLTEKISYAKALLCKTIEENASKFIKVPSVIANTNVNIRKAPYLEADLAGKLVEGHSLELLDELNNGWYKVLYYGEERYVSGEYTSKTTTYKIKGDIQKVFYTTEEKEMRIPAEISKSNSEEIITLPIRECLEVYEEIDGQYLVQINDLIGYVDKNFLEELFDVFVVVDLSDQQLKLYQNNVVILETPIISGHPDTPSDEGLFEIYKFKKQDYLRGPGYKAYVDIMMYYNFGEGLHDADGWCSAEMFGGDTYLTNGSHGCINLLQDPAMKIYSYVEKGTRVLVKK